MSATKRNSFQGMDVPRTPATLSCKLTTPELRQRKATVIASLKRLVVMRKELQNGFLYQFDATDATMDELLEFVKTERLCCDFFEFNLTVCGDDRPLVLTITGPPGTKDFIVSEVGL